MRQILKFLHRRLTSNLSLVTHSIWGFLLWFLGVSSLAYAEGAFITKSGLRTQISDPVTVEGKIQFDITGGTRAGTNLFHSFGDFNVPTNTIANFLNDSVLETSNILGRVTGGNPSSIFGTVQTTGFGNANLFLMNPSGIVFGPTAALNVGGSVTFTTANYLRFAETDGMTGIFHADSTSPNTLTSAPVAAFGFLDANPAAIAVQRSKLEVHPAHSMSFVGGNQGFTLDTRASAPVPNGVTISGTKLIAQSGQVSIASVASQGEILAKTMDTVPNINGQSFEALGKISVSQKSLIDVSGKGGGTVIIRGGQFVLDDSTISANVKGSGSIINGMESIGSGINLTISQEAKFQNGFVLESVASSNTTPGIQYGGVQIKADRIEILGSQGMENGPFTGIRSNIASENTSGNSGPINLEANSILMKHNSTLETKTFGTGNAGNIVLNAQGDLVLDGTTIQSISQSASGDAGDAGSIKIMSDQGTIRTTAATIQTESLSGSGSAGNVTLSANGDISMDGPFISANSSLGTGNAGNISLASTQGNILMTNSPFITSQTQKSTGSAGNVTVSAPRGNVLLDGGESGFGQLFTAIRPPIGAVPRTEGSGRIQIIANNFEVLTSQISGDNISSSSPGNIDVILTGTLSIGGALDFGDAVFPSKVITTSRGPARSADLNIRAQRIHATDGSVISTEAFWSGDAGTMNLVVQNLHLTKGSQIRSGSTSKSLGPGELPSSPRGAGGAINIRDHAGPADSILIDGPGSGIFTNTEGTGAGGTINLSTRNFTLQNGGTLSAETTGTSFTATGGSIVVNATDRVLLNNGASITANSTGPGDAGNISINAGRQLNVESSKITTEANQSKAGDINIQAIDQVSVVNGEISTSVHSGAGRGGDITIDPKTVILRDGTKVFAQAVQGSGGNITITTPLYLKDSTSFVNADSQFGLNGSVTIQSPTSNLSGTVGQLVSKTSPPQVLLQNRCVALAGGEQSTFILAGRDALPSEPGGWLSSPIAMDHWMGENIEEHAPGLMVQRKGRNGLPGMAALQDQTTVLSLRRLTPPGFLVRTFATGTTGCPS